MSGGDAVDYATMPTEHLEARVERVARRILAAGRRVAAEGDAADLAAAFHAWQARPCGGPVLLLGDLMVGGEPGGEVIVAYRPDAGRGEV